jgi:hypothetical protein
VKHHSNMGFYGVVPLPLTPGTSRNNPVELRSNTPFFRIIPLELCSDSIYFGDLFQTTALSVALGTFGAQET